MFHLPSLMHDCRMHGYFLVKAVFSGTIFPGGEIHCLPCSSMLDRLNKVTLKKNTNRHVRCDGLCISSVYQVSQVGFNNVVE
ncbi:hypothetical protein LDENG_00082390 [Lucifuga dentata]|nr:hypothetical protein LDENG_00082390 [Lucifuga dentata]